MSSERLRPGFLKVHDSELREQIVQQVLQQLDFIFPDGLVSAAGGNLALTAAEGG